MMKDLYSFHASEDDLWRYYEEVKKAYLKIFHRCGLKTVYTVAAGGDFTISNTHEFQVIAAVGEDAIFVCEKCEYAENSEISHLKTGDACPKCGGEMAGKKAIEVGNIFPLGTKYSKAFNLQFVDESGKKDYVITASYGIGLGRVMGAIAEARSDADGIVWPESVAPFKIHLIALDGKKDEADGVYEKLLHNSVEILYDDREDKTAGEKFADADLIGCPVRLVVSRATLQKESIEVKLRGEKEVKMIGLDKAVDDLL
jgi:prolyl-tRNA synthetase